MAGDDSHEGAYLAVDRLAANPELARRLPADMAWRFHALPLAEDGGSVTVAVANPDDAAAREAVAAALGSAVCLVQGDARAIDTLLAQVWNPGAGDPLNLGACGLGGPAPPEVLDYAQALADLLGARVTRYDNFGAAAAGQDEGPGYGGGRAAPDLLIVGRVDGACVDSLLRERRGSVPTDERAPSGPERRPTSPAAVVALPRSRWPLKRLLLVVCGHEAESRRRVPPASRGYGEDRAAIDWVAHLAQKSGAAVTVLAIVPPAPAMYGHRGGMGQDLPGLLTSNTGLGRAMRAAAQHLVHLGIPATLSLRQGPPDWQICREVAEGDHDLIGIAAEPCSRLRRWLEGDLIDHLLCRADRPVLVAQASVREG